MTHVDVAIGKSVNGPDEVILIIGEDKSGIIVPLSIEQVSALIGGLQEKTLLVQSRNRERIRLRVVNGGGESSDLRDDASTERYLCSVRI